MNGSSERALETTTGAILGLAIGDALGYPCEFRSRQTIVDCFPPDGVTDFVAVHDPRWRGGPIILGTQHAPGTYTDDTQMSLAVAEALIEAGDRDLDALMRTMARHFVAWSRSPDNDRAPGTTCMTGCANLEQGMGWHESGVAHSKGAGAPMRAVPIGLYYGLHDRSRLLAVARASSVLTHGHPAAIESSAAVALATAMAMEKNAPEAIYAALLEECAPGAPDLEHRLRQVPEMLERAPAEVLCEDGLGESWVAEEAVASALYCFWRFTDNVEAGLLAAANTDGDSDTIACITGGLLGAYAGVQAIPQRWRARVENAAGLTDVARRLVASPAQATL